MSISVMVLGRMIYWIDVQLLNAVAPIVVAVFGMVIYCSDVHCEKAAIPILAFSARRMAVMPEL